MARREKTFGEKALAALARLGECDLCPWACRVDRTRGELGVCRTGRHAQVASFQLHFGEEAPLVGERGSGTIFFGQCNLGCRFCQNWDISQPPHGEQPPEFTAQELAQAMLQLQAMGAVNINLVSPSHVAAQVLEALAVAMEGGLDLPIVWNSGGYDSLNTLALLDGVVDIYMPDAKFWDPAIAARFCGPPDYPERAREAIREMHRQVGDLAVGSEGLATRGLLVRHLVLPGGLAGTQSWMDFLAREVSPSTYVNIMEQYRPCHLASQHPELDRAPTREEFLEARQTVLDKGLRLDERAERLPMDLLRHLLGG